MAATPSCSCSALRQAARHVTRLYDAALAPAGLGLNQYAILATLDRLGPQTLQALAELLVMDRSSLGHVLRPLQSREWLTIAVGQDDRRRRLITLTPGGAALMVRARPLWAAAEAQFGAAYGAEQAQLLRTALKRVVAVDFQDRPEQRMPS